MKRADMPGSRFPFSVDRSGESATIAMDCGGLIRARTMPLHLLRTVGALCRQLLEGAEMPSGIPDFPRFLLLLRGGVHGVCQATFGAHRLDGKVERVIALYDDGDDTTPVLVLVEEQIDEFLKQTE